MEKTHWFLLFFGIVLTTVQKTKCLELAEHLRSALENLKPGLLIPPLEPLTIIDIDREIKEDNVDLFLKLRDLKVHGLLKFHIQNLIEDTQNKKLKISLLVPHSVVDGTYSLRGTVYRHFPVFGDGKIDIKLLNFQVDLSGDLSEVDGKLQIIHMSSNMKLGSVSMYLHGLFGEGPLGNIVMTLFENVFGYVLFNAYRDSLQDSFNGIAINFLNNELKKLDVSDVQIQPVPYNQKQQYSSFKPNVNPIVDEVLQDVVNEHGDEFDPMPLEEYKKGFSQRILLVTVSCEAKLYNGFVYGIKTIHRTGDFYLDSQGTNKVLSGYVGFNNLLAGYSIKLEAVGFGIELPMTANVESANVKIEVVYNKETNTSKITKYELILGKIKVHLKNLGPLSWVADPITSFIVNIIRPVLAWIIQSPVKVAVEEAFNKIIPLHPYL